MKYQCTVVIDRPRDEVVAKFEDSQSMRQWQPTLSSVEQIEGTRGEVGSVAKLVYDTGKRPMEMTERLVKRDLPRSVDYVYEARGVVNPCHNTFEELPDGKTQWTMDTEFRFSGIMALMSVFMRKAFHNETERSMNAFKSWVEST
jgi:uncharacterized membrane protein